MGWAEGRVDGLDRQPVRHRKATLGRGIHSSHSPANASAGSQGVPFVFPGHRCSSVDFSKNGIGVMGVTHMCEALKNNDTLKTLVLDTNSIGDEGAEVIAKYMAGARLRASPSPFLFCFIG
jgi:hypothetical protein